ncbi:hypothetical protein D3C77_559490 [compost metagenome]
MVAEAFVDLAKVIQAQTEHGDHALAAFGVVEQLLQLGLQQLPVGQAGEVVVKGDAVQAGFGLAAQQVVAFDGAEQVIGGVDPLAQFIVLMALEHRQLLVVGTVRVDVRQVADDPLQGPGEPPVVDQVEQQR